MTNFILEQMVTWWQFTVVGILIIIGFIINLFDEKEPKKRLGFEYTDMPHMQPIPIATKGKGFWSAIWMWLTGSRHWIVAKDFVFTIDDPDGTGPCQLVIPKGFQFDGASIPKFLHTWLSPTGVLLMGGLVHDYAYKYATLKRKGKGTLGPMTQKEADIIFRDINVEINGFKFLNYLAYWALRVGGFVAWNGHRKNDD